VAVKAFRVSPLGANGLKLEGELDLAARDVLLDALSRFTGELTLDLTDVSFMDSTGLHAILDRLPSRATILVGVPPHIMKIFKIAGMDQARGLEMHPATDDDGTD